MKFLNGGNIERIALEQIEVRGRLREVRDSFVQTLILMAEDTGLTTPIHVRRVRGAYVLIDGAHRLAAARQMGQADIAALVVECRDDEARAMEASNNLGAARMTPLQTAVFVASWKRDYYAMHPDRAPGVFKGNQHTGKLVGVNLTLTRTIADAFGVSEATVHRALRAGEGLTPDEVAQLDAAPRRVAMEDLKHLAKIGEAQERAAVVARMVAEAGQSAAKARRALTPKAAPVQDPVEAELKALKTVWSRARKEARRRFAQDHAEALAALIYEAVPG